MSPPPLRYLLYATKIVLNLFFVSSSQPEHLLNTTDNVTVQCHAPSVIIHTVAAEELSPSVSQAELTVESEIQPVDLVDPATSLETDAFPDDLSQPRLVDEVQSVYSGDNPSKFVSGSSTELINRVTVRAGEEVLDADLKCKEGECHSHFASTYDSEVRENIASWGDIQRLGMLLSVAFDPVASRS